MLGTWPSARTGLPPGASSGGIPRGVEPNDWIAIRTDRRTDAQAWGVPGTRRSTSNLARVLSLRHG